ncbi:MAG TPA: DUF2868 domain-containing protein [Deltaproteobacteria bacterium]|nr:DUF2868 domain-containing protein [Deltaproteobacteria bacterium]
MSRWKISDLIDLEFFLIQDGDTPESLLEERDREIFLKSVQPVIQNTSAASGLFRRNAIRIWLDHRRNLHQKDSGEQSVLPGDIFTDAYRILGLIIAVAGIVSGAGLALSMLVYDGVEPVNVSIYFSVLVLLQAFLVVLTLRFAFIGKSSGRLKRYSVGYPLMASLAGRLMNLALKRFPSGQQQNVEKVFGAVMTRQRLYGRVMFWTLFILMQCFGIMFNIGAVAATLVRVLTADLAFGWQSTIEVSAQAVHSMVRFLAVPWAWAVPAGIAYPSLEQIEGSRMVLKEGIYHLATGSLVSWWPFLLFAVCVYALLPRIVLCLAGVLAQNVLLAGIDFFSSGADQVIMRMMGPSVSTSGIAEEGKQGMMDGEGAAQSGDSAPAERGLPSIVLMPSDLLSGYTSGELEAVVYRRLGWKVADVMNIRGEVVSDARVLDALAEAVTKEKTGIVVIQEAWQPPIIETVEFMKELRRREGPNVQIAVLLIGKPAEGTIFTRVDRPDREVWARSLGKLGDPYLMLKAVEGDR